MKKKEIKATSAFFICSILQQGIAFFTIPIYTRMLSVNEYGEYSVFKSLILLIGIVCTLNLSRAVYMQKIVKDEKERETFTSSTMCLDTGLILIFLLIYLIFKNFFNSLIGLPTTIMILVFISIWENELYRFWSCKKRVENSYRLLLFITFMMIILKPVCGVMSITIFKEYKFVALVCSQVLVEIIFYTPLLYLQLKKCSKWINIDHWRYSVNFSLPLLPHYISQEILNQSDRLMINKIVGAAQAGIYSLAYMISRVMIVINDAIFTTLAPWMYEKIKKKEMKILSETSIFLLGIIASLNLLVIGLAPEILYIAGPEQYHEAIWAIPPVVLSVYFIFLYGLLSIAELYYAKTKFMMFASVSAGTLNVVLNAILIPRYGYLAAGYTTFVCYGLYCMGHYIVASRTIKKELGVEYINGKAIVLLTMGMIFVSILFMLLYILPFIRIGIISVTIFILFLKRKWLKNKFKLSI